MGKGLSIEDKKYSTGHWRPDYKVQFTTKQNITTCVLAIAQKGTGLYQMFVTGFEVRLKIW